MDLWKLLFTIILVLLIVAGAVWFSLKVAPQVIERGQTARVDFAQADGPAAIWHLVSTVFDGLMGGAFGLAYKIALAGFGILFGFQLIKWVNGA